nr:solute carrier family 22 member 7-like [Procambarus clarkii]
MPPPVDLKLLHPVTGKAARAMVDDMVNGGVAASKEKDAMEVENVFREGGLRKRSGDSEAVEARETRGGDGDQGRELDQVLQWADRGGAYERLLVWAWVAPVCLLAPCAYLNILLMIYLPPHTCALPPPPHSLSHDAWQNLSIPRDDSGKLSSCTMYDFPAALNSSSSSSFSTNQTLQEQTYLAAALAWQQTNQHPPPATLTTECVFGYDFDRTHFQETASTEFGWACGGAVGIQRVLRASMLGNLFGCVVYGALADKVGRRGVFLLLAVKVAVLGSVYVLVRGMWVVLALRFLISMGLPVIYQIVIISALEQVRDERRGMVTSLSSIFFSVGQCLLAPIAWLTGHWVTLSLVTSLPALLALVYIRVIEESPRWLVARGRLQEAAAVLRRVAKMNNLAPTSHDVMARLRMACGHPEEDAPAADRTKCGPLGVLSLVVSYPRLASRTALITVCWTVNLVLYFSTTMKYPYVLENPFVGWFCTSAMEVPANLLVLVLLPRVGRRTLHASVMAVTATALLVDAALLALGYEERHKAVSSLVLAAKFCSSMTFLVTYLQAAELHPTPVRTCATGFASLVALTCNTFSPSIILSMARPWHSYLLLGCIGILGVLSASLLPETAGRPLPQTLEDAENLHKTAPVPHKSGRKKRVEAVVVAATARDNRAAPPLPDNSVVMKVLNQGHLTETII